MPRKKKKNNKGGVRAGAGRKAENGKRKAYSVRLNPVEVKKINWEFGSLTNAVRSLL